VSAGGDSNSRGFAKLPGVAPGLLLNTINLKERFNRCTGHQKAALLVIFILIQQKVSAISAD
jgi:hypothetical protein